MSDCTIRTYRPADRQAVRDIAYGTAYFGGSIAAQYSDVESFADILTRYYTDQENQDALVVERAGRVVGYTLVARDARRVTSPAAYAVRHALMRGACFRRGTFRFYVRAVCDTIVDLFGAQKPKFDLARYPANTHTNLLPEARGGGIASQMYWELFDKLRQQGVPGLHAEVVAENTRGLDWFVHTLGYQRCGEPYGTPGARGPNGERLHLQLVLRDITSWQPGAWKRRQPSA